MQYGLSASLIKRIIKSPKRTEDGIAAGTVAVMQSSTNKNKPNEIWVMYKLDKAVAVGYLDGWKTGGRKKKIIISAWRYPGISPVGKRIHIPDDVLEELEKWFS